MKKKLYFLFVLLLCATSLLAQVKVQGVPRNLKHNYGVMARSATSTVDFSKINYWVGEGDKEAALVISWGDGKDGNKNLVWGYRWSDTATGADLLMAVAAADPRFYLLVNSGTQYGSAFGGFGYDLNGNGNIQLVSGDNTYDLTNGAYCCDDYSFDDFA